MGTMPVDSRLQAVGAPVFIIPQNASAWAHCTVPLRLETVTADGAKAESQFLLDFRIVAHPRAGDPLKA